MVITAYSAGPIAVGACPHETAAMKQAMTAAFTNVCFIILLFFKLKKLFTVQKYRKKADDVPLYCEQCWCFPEQNLGN